MAKLKPTSNKKARFQVYKTSNTYAKNKKRKLENHLKLHPTDEQAKKALKSFDLNAKPSRSVHVSSNEPKFKEITEQKTRNGKTVTEVVRKIRVSRLDMQLAKLAKSQLILDAELKAAHATLANVSLIQSLQVLTAHNERLYLEYIEKLKKEGKPLPKSYVESQKDKKRKDQPKNAKTGKPFKKKKVSK